MKKKKKNFYITMHSKNKNLVQAGLNHNKFLKSKNWFINLVIVCFFFKIGLERVKFRKLALKIEHGFFNYI